MKVIAPEKFYAWCSSREIEPDLRYQEPRCLIYVPNREYARFWDIPDDPDRCPGFVSHILEGTGPWYTCMAWMRGGYWPSDTQKPIPRSTQQMELLKTAGVPFGSRCALEFAYSEKRSLVDISIGQLLWGGCVFDDLFIIPDHGEMIVQTDHHDAIYVRFAGEEQMHGFVEHMVEGGYLLPDELPDETFKQPDWMK